MRALGVWRDVGKCNIDLFLKAFGECKGRENLFQAVPVIITFTGIGGLLAWESYTFIKKTIKYKELEESAWRAFYIVTPIIILLIATQAAAVYSGAHITTKRLELLTKSFHIVPLLLGQGVQQIFIHINIIKEVFQRHLDYLMK